VKINGTKPSSGEVFWGGRQGGADLRVCDSGFGAGVLIGEFSVAGSLDWRTHGDMSYTNRYTAV
jgi:hypothetical protein